MIRRTPFWLTLGAVATAFAAFALVASDSADAGRGRGRGRGRRHRFFSAQAPAKGRTPATDANGAAAGAARDVAGAAVEGPGRKNTLEGGTAIVLSATRALVANPWRGLAIVDVTDADAPVVLGSVTIDGSADRVFVSGSTALVVSRSTDAAGGTTKVIAVDLSNESAPHVTGDVSVAGDLLDASQSGGDLILTTTSFSYSMYADAGPGAAGGDTSGGDYVDAANNGLLPPGARKKSARGAAQGDMQPGFWFPWGGDGKVRVARITQDAAGAPIVTGELALDGTVLARATSGDTAVLVLDRRVNTYSGGPIYYVMGDPSGNANGGGADGGGADGGTTPGVPFSAGAIEIVAIDASAVPAESGRTQMWDLSGVSTLDVSNGVARLLGWAVDGTSVLQTYSLAGGAPTALGSAPLATWPESTAFTGDRFVFTNTAWTYGSDGGDPTNGGLPGIRKGDGLVAQPTVTTTLSVVDLADPAHPSAGGSTALSSGWVASLVVSGDDAIATTSEYSNEAQTTHIDRVDLSDAAAPAVTATTSFDGSWYAAGNTGPLGGDLLLLQGGAVTADGAWRPQALPVSLASGGVAAGAAFDASWIAASAWRAPILALGSADSLRLVDLTDIANPVQRGTVRLAVNVADLAVLGDTAAACLVTDWVGGSIEVRTVSLPAGDALAPLDTVTLGTGDARMFRDGSMLYVLTTDWSTGRGGLTVVDASDPAHLGVRGSLDLASYPGQAFLVNGSMVLVREAWSLVETNETTGKRKSLADPFGRCPTGWLRDELSAVIDVVDLSDPDAPRAAARKRVRWDAAGQAVLRGNSLYVPSYQWGPMSPDGYDQVAYGVREIDLSRPTTPRVGPLVDVPGSLVAATDDAGRVLTVSYDYDDTTGVFDSTLQLVDLRSTDWRTRVVATRGLAGTPGAVLAGDGQAYVATESWDGMTGSSEFQLAALSLADLNVSSEQARTRSAWGGTISGGHLFLRSWGWTGSIDAYALTDAANPALVATSEVDGVGTSIGVAGGRAYVPAGYRGVAAFDLTR